jgi:hypothetical protein
MSASSFLVCPRLRAAGYSTNATRTDPAPTRRVYEDELAKANAVDFDDLLLRGHELLKGHPRVVAKIQNVLIDEVRHIPSLLFPLNHTFPSPCLQVNSVAIACSSKTLTPSSTILSSSWPEQLDLSLLSEIRIRAVRCPNLLSSPFLLPPLPSSTFDLSVLSHQATLTFKNPQSTVGATLRSRTWRRCLKVRPLLLCLFSSC